MRNMSKLACVLIGAAALPQAGYAAPVLDVNNLVGGTASSGVSAQQYGIGDTTIALYQTFTAMHTGQLTSIDLFSNIGGPGNVYLSFFGGGSQTAIGSAALGNITIAASSYANVNQVYSFDLTALGIAIVAGSSYTFELAADPCQAAGCTHIVNWIFTSQGNSGFYGGGQRFDRINNNTPVASDYDLNFRTFVDPTVTAAVPEPAAWAMMILGMGAIGFAMRRRNVTTRVSYAA